MRLARCVLNLILILTSPIWIIPVIGFFVIEEWEENKEWLSGKEWLLW